MTIRDLVLYGDFNCPWSYLASLRLDRLAETGVTVEFRAVEHDPLLPAPERRMRTAETAALAAELAEIGSLLHGGEELPTTLPRLVPRTGAAISGYAEAVAAGVGPQARSRLFSAYWQESADIGNPATVRRLLADIVTAGQSASGPVRDWGYVVSISGSPMSSAAYRLIRTWSNSWHDLGGGPAQPTIPVLIVNGISVLRGGAAVTRLGDELARRTGTRPHLATTPERRTGAAGGREGVPGQRRHGQLPSRTFVSENGGRWLHEARHRAAVSLGHG